MKLASEVGIDAGEARAVLESSAYADEVRADSQKARSLGIQGVPFFAIDETYAISGGQPSAVFREVLEQVWAESHPLISVGSTTQGDAGTCDGESCAIG